MKPIEQHLVQPLIDTFKNKQIYVHLETTNGAYATHTDQTFHSAGAFIRNAQVEFSQGKLTGEGPFRVGLKMELGWIYAEGLTDFEIDEKGRLLLAGHNREGKLAIALELSEHPF
ncbi:YojF family protein [Terrilactibacillus laevilacticus]|uniref:YojF family protein n=1 Tax=Terrilactibacillus laevilacticus TaxID=1380157 RepID=A0ABW5PML5_9BACI|nr:YojF family protein [Terrilactibacillus laevilacticus]